jgi:hypothetical protein
MYNYLKMLQSGVWICDLKFPVWHINAVRKRHVRDRENQTHKPLKDIGS